MSRSCQSKPAGHSTARPTPPACQRAQCMRPYLASRSSIAAGGATVPNSRPGVAAGWRARRGDDRCRSSPAACRHSTTASACARWCVLADVQQPSGAACANGDASLPGGRLAKVHKVQAVYARIVFSFGPMASGASSGAAVQAYSTCPARAKDDLFPCRALPATSSI